MGGPMFGTSSAWGGEICGLAAHGPTTLAKCPCDWASASPLWVCALWVVIAVEQTTSRKLAKIVNANVRNARMRKGSLRPGNGAELFLTSFVQARDAS